MKFWWSGQTPAGERRRMHKVFIDAKVQAAYEEALPPAMLDVLALFDEVEVGVSVEITLNVKPESYRGVTGE